MTRFFPYDPRRDRLAFAAGAVACLLMTAWAVVATVRHSERLGLVRTAISGLLLIAFAAAYARLRPRGGWGVLLDRSELIVSHPFAAEPLHIPWDAVLAVRRERGARPHIEVRTEAGSVLIPRRYFAAEADYEAVASALQERKPPPRLDA